MRWTTGGGGIRWRLFATVWLVYCTFATTNVVRETYLAVALGSRFSVRVDEFQGLHPDLFEVPGRGWYINSNPGASILGAVPYALLVRPAIAVAAAMRPGITAPKPPATYDDPRPNRTRFMNAARERGLDVVLGLAALGTAATLMAPLAAAAAVLLFMFLRVRLGDDRRALALALVYAFATPMLFRSAFLNQNALLAHLVLAAWIVRVGLVPREPGPPVPRASLAGSGLLLGLGLVCDYSAIPFLVVFGVWILADGWRRGGLAGALRDVATYSAGAAVSISLLLGYQAIAFGHPAWPAQRYMPPTEYSVRGWLGFTLPSRELLAGNLFDLRYGLLAFCPMLLLALALPLVRGNAWRPRPAEGWWILASVAALWLFASATQFASLQWNTGVRYMVPAVPLLFIASVPVLEALPRTAWWLAVGASGMLSLAVSMTREAVPVALHLVATEGPTLPVLTVLRKMESGYAGLQLPSWTFWLAAVAVATAVALVWRWPARAASRRRD